MFSENELICPDLTTEIYNPIDLIKGSPVLPLDKLKIMDAGSWEVFTLELVSYWKQKYESVTRCGGSGDLGRDVIAYTPNGNWENFQCKYYSRPINLSEGIREIGKLIYYTKKGYYRLPKKFYFVAPLGVSSQFLNHLMSTDKLKEAIKNKWDKECKTKITKKEIIEYSTVCEFIDEEMDFSIFKTISPIKLLEIHSNTQYYAIRFGGPHKRRPKPQMAPEEIKKNEQRYIAELLSAFSEYKKTKITVENLESNKKIKNEFNSARNNFYSAESLERFSRDWLPKDSYSNLLDECYEAISSTLFKHYENGFLRYLNTTEQAVRVAYQAHPLYYYIQIKDKKGFCHQLANLEIIKWVEESE